MKLIIQDESGRKTVVPLVADEISIGRNDQNLVWLNEKNVSRKHGRLVRVDGRYTIEDLGSFTGIRVNGERIRGKREIAEGDLIQISEYDLTLQGGPDEQPGVNGPVADEKPGVNGASPDEEQQRRMAETATVRLSDLKPSAIIESPPQEVPERQRPKLLGITGTFRGKELTLHRTPIRIGRSDENDLVVDHPSISRRHLRMHLENGAWKVMDAESRNGVRVNGEPYAQIGLRHGDVIEAGHLRFAFVEPGRPFKLPQEFVPVPPPVGPVLPAQRRTGRVVAISLAVAGAMAGGGWLLFRHRPLIGSDEASAERKFGLRAAEEARAAHRYNEALRDLDLARRAGASEADLPGAQAVEAEARSEDLYREMESAAAAQDWERAGKLLGILTASKTYYGAKAAERSEAIAAGYVNAHLGAAALMKGKDNAGCLAEAQLALAANPRSGAARSLVDACKGSPALTAAARAASPSPRPSVLSASFNRGDDGAARQLVSEGNQKLTAQDLEAALALFRKALSFKPAGSVLGGAYRGLGIVYTRQGNVEQGARYYRLYLPLCSDSAERAQLQRVLADYDARRK